MFDVLTEVEGVDTRILDPRTIWANGQDYDRAGRSLADRFRRNFTQFAKYVDESILAATPPGAFDA